MNLQGRWLATILVTSLAAHGIAQVRGKMNTRWTKLVDPAHVLPEYPRPTMVREHWTNLNGWWDFQVGDPAASQIDKFDHKILVPFPPESELSGYHKMIPVGGWVKYRRTFEAKADGGHVLLHFGAVDWECHVSVNGKEVGSHKGGFDPFTIDVTKALHAGPNELIVTVKDPTDQGPQPRGKQVLNPEGIYYTPTTGIWQTVWLEQVPAKYIQKLWIEPKPDDGIVGVRPIFNGPADGLTTKVEVFDAGVSVAVLKQQADRTLALEIPDAKWWSPEDPHLYDLVVTLLDGAGKQIDRVKSYFAFRTVSIGPGKDGKTRILLNGEPTFMIGPLDQGFWPDGLFTAPTDAALKFDIEETKKLGFNMIRKHVKVEPERWYMWCDRMGMLVWQDMPSGEKSIHPDEPDIERTPESKAIFEHELKAMIDAFKNHPSIVCWVLFNEGWGQYDTARMTEVLRSYDRTRIIDAVTGWADRGVGDMHDWHIYPGPDSPKPEPTRAAVLGEFGGLGLVTPGHMWLEKGWGYQSYKTPEELTEAFESLFLNLRLLIADPGLSAAVYTQTTDVETETNGLLTYDRAVEKMDPKRVRAAVQSLFLPAPTVTELVPTSETEPQKWWFTTEEPHEGWQAADFDHNAWREADGGFGTVGTPGASVGTVWDGSDIWIRRQFASLFPVPAGEVCLRVHHDDDAEVYLDGVLIAKLAGHTSKYKLIKLPKGLTIGRHVIAIHCHQEKGGQYIDAGFVRVKG